MTDDADPPPAPDPPPQYSLSAVCFDLDDTLYPYEAYARAGLREAAARLEELTGRDCRDELLELYFDAGVTEGTFDRLLDRHDLPGELVEELVEAYHGADDPLPPRSDAERVLASLGAAHGLGVITDGRNGIAKLRRLDLIEHFDAVVVGPTIGCTKRDPRAFDHALAELEVSPDRTAYVGDDPRVDFEIPNRLGMVTVRLRRGRYADLDPPDPAGAPDHEVHRLADVHGIVAGAVPDSGDAPDREESPDGGNGPDRGTGATREPVGDE